MSVQPRNRPGQQAHPGDVTGRKREALAREHSEEIKAREGEISMITAERDRSKDEDIIDLETREVISGVNGSIKAMDADVEDKPVFIGSASSDMEIEELPDPKQVPDDVMRAYTTAYLEEKVVIRVNSDLEDVTLGAGNNFSFLEGRRYHVPRWVANHLEEKGVCG